MKKSKIILAAFAAVILAAPPSSAQAPTLDARISLRVEGRSLEEVVQFLSERSGANIVIVKGGETPISLDLNDVDWRDALELAAELAGCVVEERTAGVLVIDSPPRVDFVFSENTPLTEVVDAIAAVSGANIIVAPEVSGTLSLRFRDVPWRDALEVAVKTLGYTVVEDTRGILRIVDPLTLQSQMETRSYQLRYLRPRATYAPVIKSEFLTGKLEAGSGDLKKDFPIIDALRKALSQSGELDYVDSLNVIIVRDTVQVHESIKDMVERLDIEPAQVFVDVKFVSTSTDDVFTLGVDWGDDGPSISANGGQIPITLPFTLGSGGWEDYIIASTTGVGPFADPTLNAPSNTVIPDTIFGAMSFTNVAATLRMIQKDSRTEIVQAPKVITMDGRPATIFVGETIRFAEAKSEVGQTGNLQLSVAEADGSPVEVGFQLLVVPHIIPGTNRLSMDVIPKETSLSGTSNSPLAPPGFDTFSVGSGGDQGTISLPRIRTSTVVTSMMLHSGQTAVVGGLTTDAQVESEKRVPYLSAIPILGELFKVKSKTSDRRSLLVFLTPTIVRTSSESADVLRRELDRRREIYQQEFDRLMSDISVPPATDDETPAAPEAPAAQDG